MQVLPTKLAEAKEKDEVFFIELYNIYLRTGAIYIAACDVDITFNGTKYVPIPIERGTVTKTVDNKTDNMDLKIADVDYAKLAFLLKGFDFRNCKVEVFRIMYPDSLTDSTLWQGIFCGNIDSPSYEAGIFSCTVIGCVPDVDVPRRSCQLCCNAEFGNPADCGMSKDVRPLVLTEGTTQGAICYGDTNMQDYWKDGIVTIEGESRMIRESTDKVYLMYPFFQEIAPGMRGTIERGCDKRALTCRNRYNNMANFSGFPSIPWESVYR